jgi:hypothetical protein
MSSGEHPIAERPGGDDAAGVRKTAESRTVKVDQLRTRIARADYHVDSHAVAEAIIARLKAGGTVSDGARSRSSAPRPPLR